MCYCDPSIRTPYCKSFKCQEERLRIQNKDTQLRDRKGRFSIDLDLINRNPDEMSAMFMMLAFVPFRAECMYMNNTIEYQGLSYLFDIVHGCQVTPEYTIEITKLENGITEVKAVKVIK